MKTLKLITTLITTLLLGFTGCKKGEMGTRMLVNMTDAPGDYRNVFIDLQKVMIHYENAPESKWIELRAHPGIYDLLTLQNNATAFIAEEDALPVGKISQMRLELGNNNSVVTKEGAKYTLTIPSSATSGLKINIHQNMNIKRTVTVLLDFDAGSSVKVNGNGEYSLEPVIKAKQVITN
jgi:hypothetical protein